MQENQKKFVFEFDAQEYIDFNRSHLYIQCQIVKQDGTALIETDLCSVINCFGLNFRETNEHIRARGNYDKTRTHRLLIVF